MTNRGFLKTVGGHTRMRFVKPGFDANDMNVPSNSVIFDSDVDGMASVLEVGEGSVPLVTTGTWLRQWSYDFVPLCVFSFKTYVTLPYWEYQHEGSMAAGLAWTMLQQRITVSKQGIWVRRGSRDLDTKIRWVAFRISAHG